VSQVLLDDFRACQGYIFLSEFLLRWVKWTVIVGVYLAKFDHSCIQIYLLFFFFFFLMDLIVERFHWVGFKDFKECSFLEKYRICIFPQKMLSSESVPQELSDEWSCQYVLTILNFWGQFLCPVLCDRSHHQSLEHYIQSACYLTHYL
jgi:hypothetical protein